MTCILESTVSGCNSNPTHGIYYWTAGQRMDPSSTQSTFVWRTSNTYVTTVFGMTYTNWGTDQPQSVRLEPCMLLTTRHYTWHDVSCNTASCSVCELDISQ